MNLIRKTMALGLSFSLLGQSALFAAPRPQQDRPPLKSAAQDSLTMPFVPSFLSVIAPQSAPAAEADSLAFYQQRARAAVSDDAWIEREGVAVLKTLGITGGLLIAQHLLHQKKIKRMQAHYNQQLSNQVVQHREKEVAWLQEKQTMIESSEKNQTILREELRLQRQERAELEQAMKEQNKVANNKIDNLSKARLVQRERLQRRIDAAAAREAELQKMLNEAQEQINTVSQQLNSKAERFRTLTSYSRDMEKELAKYGDLFRADIPAAQQQKLIREVLKEPWMQALQPEQRKRFLKAVKTAAGIAYNSPHGASDFLLVQARLIIEETIPFYERMVALSRHLFRMRNMTVVALFIALGLSAHDVQAQNVADRINANVELFLNATPQELAEFENNEEVRQVCIEAAAALEILRQTDAQQRADISAAMQLQHTQTQRQLPRQLLQGLTR